jgi:hypothetical protein
MRAKAAKNARQPKKAAGKPKADRFNKTAEFATMMKRPKDATLARSWRPVWQAHTVRGFDRVV